jgi:hypothetical protein
MQEKIITYKELCILENVKSIQKGMSFRINPRYSVILMSRKNNACYTDKIKNSETIIYQGHNIPAQTKGEIPELVNQPYYTKKNKLTENGKFALAAYLYKMGKRDTEYVKVYEKIYNGVWIDRGLFMLVDYEYVSDGKRMIFNFLLEPFHNFKVDRLEKFSSRYIPSDVKKSVWKRDGGKCVICGTQNNLHFDHDLPYSKGGSSINEKNVRILCAKCNLSKSDKIE